MQNTSRSFLDGRVILHSGDSLDVLERMEPNSVDSVVCDPPYHLASIVKRFAKTGRTDKTRSTSGPHQRTASGFMNKMWDGGDVAFRVETWAKVLRVLKPGGYILAFSSSRTFGRMSVAIEDAGFITHPMIGWLFGSGFPKATRIKAEGYDGWRYGGQALKPALEPIYMGQKPFSEESGTANILRWGSGAINVFGCLVGNEARHNSPASTTSLQRKSRVACGYRHDAGIGPGAPASAVIGRWPANLIHDGSDEVIAGFPTEAGAGGAASGPSLRGSNKSVARGVFNGLPNGVLPSYHGDSGSAARFFYAAKADADDRLGSRHPTVKPLDFIQYLVRLVTPKGGTVLDCFAGTGTTGEAAYREGMNAILVERETEYQNDIARRMILVLAGPDERARESTRARAPAVDHGPLFGGITEDRGIRYGAQSTAASQRTDHRADRNKEVAP